MGVDIYNFNCQSSNLYAYYVDIFVSQADWLTKKAMIEGTAMYFDNNNAKKFMDWSQSKVCLCSNCNIYSVV